MHCLSLGLAMASQMDGQKSMLLVFSEWVKAVDLLATKLAVGFRVGY
jgi:hypothetical protein